MRSWRVVPLTAVMAGMLILGSGIAPAATTTTAATTATAAGLDGGPVFVGSPTARAARAGTSRPTRITSSEAPSAVAAPATSRIWAGWAVTPGTTGGQSYRFVRSTWRVQPTTCPTPNAWAVFWVGLDGFGTGTVEQGGSSARCVNGTPVYQLWWEMFPTNSIQPVLTVNVGDLISASVRFDAATSLYTIALQDSTTGGSFTTTQACAAGLTCGHTTAEVIAEAPSTASGPFPLANYGKVNFTSCAITDIDGLASTFRTSTPWNKWQIQQTDGVTTYATTGAHSTDGRNFAVTWNHE